MPNEHIYPVSSSGIVLVIPNNPNPDETERLYDMYVVVETPNIEYFTSHDTRVASLNPEDEGTRWEVMQDQMRNEDSTRVTLRYYSEADGTRKNPAPADKVYPYRALRYKTPTIYPRVNAANKTYTLLTSVDKLPYNTDLTLCIHMDALRKLVLTKTPYRELLNNHTDKEPMKNALLRHVTNTRNTLKELLEEDRKVLYWLAENIDRANNVCPDGITLKDCLRQARRLVNNDTHHTETATVALQEALNTLTEVVEPPKTKGKSNPAKRHAKNEYLLACTIRNLVLTRDALLDPVERWYSEIVQALKKI